MNGSLRVKVVFKKKKKKATEYGRKRPLGLLLFNYTSIFPMLMALLTFQ